MHNMLNNKTVGDETSPEGSKTERSDILTDPIPDSYGSTPEQDKSVQRFYVPCCGLVFYITAFFGFFCSFTLRESLSVAIVAMVNQTTLTEMDIAMTNASDEAECPRDPELEHEGGELNWDRNQVAVVLAAFYYGHIFTLVRSIKTYILVVHFIMRMFFLFTYPSTRFCIQSYNCISALAAKFECL